MHNLFCSSRKGFYFFSSVKKVNKKVRRLHHSLTHYFLYLRKKELSTFKQLSVFSKLKKSGYQATLLMSDHRTETKFLISIFHLDQLQLDKKFE